MEVSTDLALMICRSLSEDDVIWNHIKVPVNLYLNLEILCLLFIFNYICCHIAPWSMFIKTLHLLCFELKYFCSLC